MDTPRPSPRTNRTRRVPQNDLTYMRIDTKRFEILVAPFWGEVKYQVLATLHVSA